MRHTIFWKIGFLMALLTFAVGAQEATPRIYLNMEPANLVGGESATGRIGLDAPAPPGGVKIDLSSDNPHIKLPESVVIPANQDEAVFIVKTEEVSRENTVVIEATSSEAAQQQLISLLPRQTDVSELEQPERRYQYYPYSPYQSYPYPRYAPPFYRYPLIRSQPNSGPVYQDSLQNHVEQIRMDARAKHSKAGTPIR